MQFRVHVGQVSVVSWRHLAIPNSTILANFDLNSHSKAEVSVPRLNYWPVPKIPATHQSLWTVLVTKTWELMVSTSVHHLCPFPLQKSVAVVLVVNGSLTTCAQQHQILLGVPLLQCIRRIGISQNLLPAPVPGPQRCLPAILRKSPRQLLWPQVGEQILPVRQLSGEKVHSSPAASKIQRLLHPHRHGSRGYSV